MAEESQMYVVDSPYELARWRPLVQWVLVIPHFVIQSALSTFAQAVWFIYWLVLIFTGKLDRGLYGVLAMSERYSGRVNGFLFGFTEQYPPFDFGMGPADNGAFPPIKVNLPESPPAASRAAAFNVFLAIPHYIVFVFYAIAAFFVALVAWFAVLFTGAWPKGMRDFIVRVTNYYLSIWAYVAMVRSDYPSFGLPPAA